MEITITLPKSVVDAFISDYEEVNGVKPTEEQIVAFFKDDIVNVYTMTVENDGFMDAI